MNSITIKDFSEEIQLEVKRTRYASNNGLALETYEQESGEPYSTLFFFYKHQIFFGSK